MHLHGDIKSMIAQAESVSRQIRGWADSLQNGDVAGQRHLNDASLAEYRAKHSTVRFLQELRRRFPLPSGSNLDAESRAEEQSP